MKNFGEFFLKNVPNIFLFLFTGQLFFILNFFLNLTLAINKSIKFDFNGSNDSKIDCWIVGTGYWFF